MDEPAPESLDMRGTPLRLRRRGSGPPLLFLHDEAALDFWPPALERLARRFAVIAPEHPGFGGSAMPDWLDRPADLGCFYLDLLARLDLAGVHLAGAALGGWVAAELAIRNTQRLASLTLLGATGILVPGLSGLDTFVTGDEQTIRDLFHDRAPAEAAIARALAPEREDTMLRDKMATAKLTWQPRQHDPHLGKWLHRIDVPTLIVWGAEDRVLPRDYADAWRRAVPGAEVVLLPECGHLPHIERPEAVAAAIEGFVSRRRAAA